MTQELEHAVRRLSLLEDKIVPTEEDNIREMILKNSNTQAELVQEKEKSTRLNAQVEFLKNELKSKLPLLKIRKNEFQHLQSNYAQIKEKLGFAIKTANAMKKECEERKVEAEKLT